MNKAVKVQRNQPQQVSMRLRQIFILCQQIEEIKQKIIICNEDFLTPFCDRQATLESLRVALCHMLMHSQELMQAEMQAYNVEGDSND